MNATDDKLYNSYSPCFKDFWGGGGGGRVSYKIMYSFQALWFIK